MDNDWISVTERLPEPPDHKGIRVIVGYTCEGQFEQAYAMFRTWMFEPITPRFELSGGDWEADFSAPDFIRRGLGYYECEDLPVTQITHWRPELDPPAPDSGVTSSQASPQAA